MVRQGLAGGSPEHREGKTSLGKFKEAAEEGGRGPNFLVRILPRGGPGRAILWVGKLGVIGSYAAKIDRVYVSFLRQVSGIKAQKMVAKTWQKEGVDMLIQAAGNKTLEGRQVTVVDCVSLQKRKLTVGFHHGRLQVVPVYWTFSNMTIKQLIENWSIGNERENILPFFEIKIQSRCTY